MSSRLIQRKELKLHAETNVDSEENLKTKTMIPLLVCVFFQFNLRLKKFYIVLYKPEKR